MGREVNPGAVSLLSAVLLNCHGKRDMGKPMVARAAEPFGALRDLGQI